MASGRRRLYAFSISTMMRSARREWPPSSKKLSRIPTRPTFKTFDQSRASVCSTGFLGATYVPTESTRARSGDGSAFRSILPLGVKGSFSSRTNAEGIIYSGSSFLRWFRKSATSRVDPGRGSKYATRNISPDGARRAAAIHWATISCRPSTASISPNSIRNPRTFTWLSARPRHSRSPPGSHRPESPVR